MNGLTFAHPWVLALLPLIPLAASAWFVGVRRGVRAARHVSRIPLAPPPYLAATLFSIAAVSAVLAAAQPRWGTVESRISHGFRLLLARRPHHQELTILIRAFERSRSEFANDSDAAGQLLTVGEARADDGLNPTDLAAFTMLASTLLNLDETIAKP